MLILASGSPRRRELLRWITKDFRVHVADVDETLPDHISPYDAVAMLSRKKAEAVAVDFPTDMVLGADTVVALDGVIFGKPADEEEAFRMLSLLSGKTHEVLTGVTLCLNSNIETFVTISSVTFYPLSDLEIRAYIATGEPMDKAGAYGIQERGGLLVKEIKGDYFNIVGLPIAPLSRKLFEQSVTN